MAPINSHFTSPSSLSASTFNKITPNMLQRVSAFKPARLINNVSRCINYETRAYMSSNTTEDAAKVSAVYKRLGVDLSDSSLMTQSITHKSFSHGSVPTNEKLGYLGRTFLELHITEQKWDKVNSNRTLKGSVSRAISSDKLSKVARSLGVDEVLRWKSPSSTPGAKVGEDTVLAHTMEAIVGAVYHDKGSKAAREFVNKHIYTY
ncbi:hypothetical protein BGX27_006389 [Mortierella sp. AM989]|nr:hypothetical protein BGX27_006389 [Mortierella sp. AM989]